jgi:hypothetical protein
MAVKKKVIRIIKDIDNPKLKDKLLKLFIERNKLMKQKEKEQQEQIKTHNKYLPKYLSPKILNAVGFIEYTKRKGELNMPSMTKFLKEVKGFTEKEMSWVLLLLSFEAVEEILSTPEVGGMIRDAIQKNRGTIH